MSGTPQTPADPMAQADGTAFEVLRPAAQTAPLVLASPHSGRDYSAEFTAIAQLKGAALRRSEDSFVDELFAAGPGCGAPLIRALFPRAYLDVNREPYELDPAMFEDALPPYVNAHSPRVRGGLGTIARVVADGAEIYRGKLRFADAAARIERCYEPYHAALGALVRATEAAFGFAVLLDCHSMPSIGGPIDRDPGAARADIVLGDRFATSCHPSIAALVERVLTQAGYAVRRNEPYAGGFTTQYYGRPHLGVHALQIEVKRSLYMDETRFEHGPGFAGVAATMTRVIEALAGMAPMALAAE